MAKKIIQGEKMQEVIFEIDKKAFNGPFICHGKTGLTNKKISVNGNTFNYQVWLCNKCKKEFLDTGQANKLEKIWTLEKLLDDRLLTMQRSINYDGKMFFLRFPKELTKTWKKGDHADIKIIDLNRFIVEIKC